VPEHVKEGGREGRSEICGREGDRHVNSVYEEKRGKITRTVEENG